MDIIKNNLDMILNVGKWVLIILITGFIAQFGKQFASYIIMNFKGTTGKDGDDFTSKEPGDTKDLPIDKKQLKQIAKIEKKKAKNEKKSRK